jgi:hypothetical protein
MVAEQKRSLSGHMGNEFVGNYIDDDLKTFWKDVNYTRKICQAHETKAIKATKTISHSFKTVGKGSITCSDRIILN